MEDRSTVQESLFACNMTAIAPAERKEHIAAIEQVFGAVEEIREISAGYSFRVANETAMLLKLASFIAKERLCCPFFGFSLEVEPEGGALWLRLTGREGVKPFIQAEIGQALSKSVAWP